MNPLPALKNLFTQLFALTVLSGLISCSETPPEKPPSTPEAINPQEAPKVSQKDPDLTAPLVQVEELDQYQEYYKEQHTTSFSHVRNKNWFSFRAGKDGILTKILLYGKPTVRITAYYGNSMSGFIREGNPSTGPKYGAWKLSRDDILNQLAAQSLTENDSGWITIHMLGQIPQQTGKTYFLVCDKIPEKSWFGDFAFGEGNPYPHGRIWFNPDHDLVFRTYVGKTLTELEQSQGQPNPNRPGPQANSAPAPIPVPVQALPLQENLTPVEPEVLPEKPNVPTPAPERFQPPPRVPPQLPPANLQTPELETPKKPTVPSSTPPQTQADPNGTKKNSLFNRLFKKE